MNIILFDDKDYLSDKSKIRLYGDRFDHISNVLNSKVNDLLRVGMIEGNSGIGKVAKIGENFVDITPNIDQPPLEPLSIILLLALPRPKVFKRVLRHVTTLGVKKLYLINSFRVEKSYWSSPVLGEKKLNLLLLKSLELANDTLMPKVYIKTRFKPFVEDQLPEIVKNSVPIVAHPFNSCTKFKMTTKKIVLAIGPEGGFIQYEIEKLQECGFTVVSFGERILPVETAVPSIISKLIL